MRHRRSVSGVVGLAAIGLGSLLLFAQERQIGGVGLTIFAELDFQGRTATVLNDTSDFRRINMNDAARSLRVGPGEQWQVCEHSNFRGRCMVVSGAEADLGPSGFDRIISSARRVRSGV